MTLEEVISLRLLHLQNGDDAIQDTEVKIK